LKLFAKYLLFKKKWRYLLNIFQRYSWRKRRCNKTINLWKYLFNWIRRFTNH